MTVPFDALGQVPPAAAYGLLAAVVLAESVLLVGAFVPTLTLLLTAGALARSGQLNLFLVVAVAACAVVAGDLLGHRTGRLLGTRLRTGRLGRRVPDAAWRRAEALMARRGGQAVFLSRFVPVVRTVTPHLAGATRLPCRRMAPYSASAALLWAGAEAGAGYAAAPALERALAVGGPLLAATAVVVTVVVLIRLRLRRRNRTSPRVCRGRRPGPPAPALLRSVLGAEQPALVGADQGARHPVGAAVDGDGHQLRRCRLPLGPPVTGVAAGHLALGHGHGVSDQSWDGWGRAADRFS
ncbi:Inner membrane protein YghB [Streptomyces sp. MP131-18]|nr:Inner membrane protein YghB [Streptomyces sp. MP131-18]